MHSDDVTTTSKVIVSITGPATPAPNNAASSGTPMKPVFEKVATKAPKAPLFQPMRPRRVTAITPPTIVTAPNPQTISTGTSNNSDTGVRAPKR